MLGPTASLAVRPPVRPTAPTRGQRRLLQRFARERAHRPRVVQELQRDAGPQGLHSGLTMPGGGVGAYAHSTGITGMDALLHASSLGLPASTPAPTARLAACCLVPGCTRTLESYYHRVMQRESCSRGEQVPPGRPDATAAPSARRQRILPIQQPLNTASSQCVPLLCFPPHTAMQGVPEAHDRQSSGAGGRWEEPLLPAGGRKPAPPAQSVRCLPAALLHSAPG